MSRKRPGIFWALTRTLGAHCESAAVKTQRREKRGIFFFCAVSSVMWRASTPDLLSDGLVLEKLVPVEPEKKNEVQYVLIWLMDGFSAVLRLLHASYFVIKILF